jgi:hypothetical protein
MLPPGRVCAIVFACKASGLAVARLSETAPHRILDRADRERLAILAAQASRGVARWMSLAFGAELLTAACVFGAKGITESGIWR